ncbi:exported protein of unknown function [Paraburkholderia kururiensis]
MRSRLYRFLLFALLFAVTPNPFPIRATHASCKKPKPSTPWGSAVCCCPRGSSRPSPPTSA